MHYLFHCRGVNPGYCASVCPINYCAKMLTSVKSIQKLENIRVEYGQSKTYVAIIELIYTATRRKQRQ